MNEIRKELCLNGLWDFKCPSDDPGAEWTRIAVPGCYSLNRTEGKWAHFFWDSMGYPDEWCERRGVYRRRFTLPKEMEGMNVFFRCGGCYHHSRTFLNGRLLGENHDGYYPFEYDLTPWLQGENELVIEVEETKPWTMGGESDPYRGIWKDTYLLAYSDAAVMYGAWIETSVTKGALKLILPIHNFTKRPLVLTPRIEIMDARGESALSFEGPEIRLEPGQTDGESLSCSWSDPRLWFPHDPYLYTAHVRLFDDENRQTDHFTQTFGFREISTDKHRLLLNGRELYLRGHGGHYCGDLQGTREYARAWISALKEKGVNFMRMHIHPRHRELYQAADELGFLIEAEAAYHFTVPREESRWQDHISRMIRDQRNHPSVIMWSVSNELRWRGGGEKPEMIDFARSLDPTRPVFASDFSLCSTQGDLLGHHYNADTVFDEWEEFGPDKPMVWDELGNVWQPERPLKNGTAGYEVTCQDYATGLWRDGHDDMLHDLKIMAEGRIINGELHRVNAFIPWDLSYIFFRFQPTNGHRTRELYPDPEGPGIKNRRIGTCSSTLNIWDDALPRFEPNPGFYFFRDYLNPVRITDTPRTELAFGGESLNMTSRIEYDDLRECRQIVTTLADESGKTLLKQVEELSLKPGEILESLSFALPLPRTEYPTKVRLARTFSNGTQPGYVQEREITLFPVPADLPQREIPIGEDLSRQDREWVKKGGRLIVCHPGGSGRGKPRFLLHGAKHPALDGIDQKELTAWNKGTTPKPFLELPPSGNYRNILAGNCHGEGSSLYEEIIGRGCVIHTSLDLGDPSDPLMLWLRHNCDTYLKNYRSSPSIGLVNVYGSRDKKNVLARAGLLPTDEPQSRALIDGKYRPERNEIAQWETTLSQGGFLFFDRPSPGMLPVIEELTGKRLRFTEPFLGETERVIKAARCYTLRTTPPDPVEYYQGMAIPQPFEANYHPCLSGIANWDLICEGDAFSRGIEEVGMNPLVPSRDISVLLTNWRIDWSQPRYGGEYIQESKDIRRADWFHSRNALLIAINVGPGTVWINQLNLENLRKPHLFINKFFTHLGCSLGKENHLPKPYEEPEKVKDQEERLAPLRKLPLARRDEPTPQGSPLASPENRKTATSRILLLGDPVLEECRTLINGHLGDWGEAVYAGEIEADGSFHKAYLLAQREDLDKIAEKITLLQSEGTVVFLGVSNTDPDYSESLRVLGESHGVYLHEIPPLPVEETAEQIAQAVRYFGM